MAEHIDLWWDGDPPAEYMRGHVSDEEARETMETVIGFGASKDPWEIKHRWARWEPAGHHMRACGCDRVMQIYDEQGRGMFAVTEMRIPKHPTVPCSGDQK